MPSSALWRATRGLRTAVRLVERALEEAGIPADRVRAVGAAVPGAIDTVRGVCTVAPNLGWTDVPIEQLLGDTFGVPVVARNIAHAAAAAEHAFGAAQGVENLVWLHVGTGVGAGVINGGRLVTGASGLTGEIGHCPVQPGGPTCSCGRRGCLEPLASGAALAQAAGTADARDAIARSAAGDRRARRAVDEVARWLARGVATLIDIVDPQLVVVGGGLAGAGDDLLEPMRSALAGLALRDIPIIGSALGDAAEVTGAVLLAQQRATETIRVESSGGR